MSFSVADISSFKVTPISEVDPTQLRTAQKSASATNASAPDKKDDQKPIPQPTQAEQASRLASQGENLYQIAAALGISVAQANLALGIQLTAAQREAANAVGEVANVKSDPASGQVGRVSLEA